MSWFGATHFAEFFNLRLPTEYEWEKAASGNGDFDYPWASNEIETIYANYFYNEDFNSESEPYEPGNGINPMNWDKVIGSIAKKNYKADELI